MGAKPIVLFAVVVIGDARGVHPVAIDAVAGRAPRARAGRPPGPRLGKRPRLDQCRLRHDAYRGPGVARADRLVDGVHHRRTAGEDRPPNGADRTGRTVATASVRGNWDVRVASPGGDRVALMAPFRAGRAPWSPGPRATTAIVVADPSGTRPAMRFHLKGNFEPEAFSTDGSRLFMISYLPPARPASYRVVGLNLARGMVFPLFGREKQWVGRMSGTRLMQTPAPTAGSCSRCTRASRRSMRGVRRRAGFGDPPVAFVHTLNLDLGQAVCVGLPKALWGGNPRYEAIVSSGTDSRVYVVDTSRGLVAVISSDTLNVIQTAKVASGCLRSGRRPRRRCRRTAGRSTCRPAARSWLWTR